MCLDHPEDVWIIQRYVDYCPHLYINNHWCNTNCCLETHCPIQEYWYGCTIAFRVHAFFMYDVLEELSERMVLETFLDDIFATGSRMSGLRKCRPDCTVLGSNQPCIFCTEWYRQQDMQNSILTSNKLKIPSIGYVGSYFDLSVSILNFVDGVTKSVLPRQFLMSILSFIKDITGMDYLDIFMKFISPIKHAFRLVFDIMADSVIKFWPSDLSNLSDDDEDAVHATMDFNDPLVENFFSGLHKAGVKRNTIVKSDFVARVANFCGMILALPFFRKFDIDLTCLGFTHAFERKRKKMYQYDHIVQLLDMIMLEMKYFIEKVAIAVKNGDIGYILYDDDDRRRYDYIFDFLNYYYTRNELNVVDNAIFYEEDGKQIDCTLEWYYNQTDLLLVFNEKLALSCEDPSVKKDLKWQHAQITKMNLASGDLLRVFAERKEPFALVIYAPPDTGKTALGEHSCHLLFQNGKSLKTINVDYDPSMKYTMNQRDEFWSGFRTSAMVAWLDDCGQYTPKITEQMKGGAIAQSVEMVNKVPLNTNQAGLNEKGKVPFKCPFIIVTTNIRDAGISSVFQKGAGALRRFTYVDPTVKEEYRQPGTLKMRGCGDPKVIDLWDIRIRRYTNVGSAYNEEFLVSFDENGMVWGTQGHQGSVFGMRDYQKILYYLQKEQRDKNDIADRSLEFFRTQKNCEVCHCVQMFCECELTDDDESSACMKVGDFNLDDPLVKCFMRTYGAAGVVKMGINEMKYRSSQSKHYKTHVNKYLIAAGVAGILTGLTILHKTVKACANLFSSKNSLTFATGQSQSSPWVFDGQHVSNVKTTPVGVDLDDMRDILQRNSCFIFYKDSNGNFVSMNMLGLHGCVAVIPRHFFFDCFPWMFKDGDYDKRTGINMYIIRGNVQLSFSLNNKILVDDSCLMSGDGDYVFINHPNIGPFRDIRKYFVNEVIKGKLDCLSIIRNKEGKLREETINACQFKEKFSYKIDKVEDFGNITTCGYGGYYTKDMSSGVCGSPYFTQLPNKRVVILGIQVATGDTNGKAYCQVIYQSDIPGCDLNSMPSKFDLQSFYNTDMNLDIKKDLHPKDPLRNFEGVLDVVGSLDAPRAKLKSQVCPTLMSKDVMKWYNLQMPTHYSPKDVNSKECILNNYKYVTNKADIPPRLVSIAVEAMIKWYMRIIDDNKLSFPKGPYSMDVGINGIDGVQYVDRLVGHTSAGFAHRGRKDKFFFQISSDDIHEVKYDIHDDIKDEIKKLIACYEQGEKSPIVADYCFKDEPITMKKVMANDARLFNSMPLSFNILFRMYFLPFVPLFSGNLRHLFGHAVGCNPFSNSWKVLYDYLTVFGLDRIIAGDWKKFDKEMIALILSGSFNVLKELANNYGWTEYDLIIMKGLITDLVYCLVNVFNTLVMLSGNNPSGQPFTTIINGIAGTLYLMIIFVVLAEENNCDTYDLSHWTDFVRSLVYGDDNVMGVHKDYLWFNHSNIARVAATFGLKYTMADKQAESVPYIHMKKVEFLKRAFVVRNGHVFAPLNTSSIIKSLHMCTKSKNVSFKQQNAEIIYSANMEFFQYGKKRFNHEHAFFQKLLDKYELRNYIKDGKLPTYDDFCEKFHLSSTRCVEKENYPIVANVENWQQILDDLESDDETEFTGDDPWFDDHGYLEDEFNEFTLDEDENLHATWERINGNWVNVRPWYVQHAVVLARRHNATNEVISYLSENENMAFWYIFLFYFTIFCSYFICLFFLFLGRSYPILNFLSRYILSIELFRFLDIIPIRGIGLDLSKFWRFFVHFVLFILTWAMSPL